MGAAIYIILRRHRNHSSLNGPDDDWGKGTCIGLIIGFILVGIMLYNHQWLDQLFKYFNLL